MKRFYNFIFFVLILFMFLGINNVPKPHKARVISHRQTSFPANISKLHSLSCLNKTLWRPVICPPKQATAAHQAKKQSYYSYFLFAIKKIRFYSNKSLYLKGNSYVKLWKRFHPYNFFSYFHIPTHIINK